jgi:hypothetical protein
MDAEARENGNRNICTGRMGLNLRIGTLPEDTMRGSAAFASTIIIAMVQISVKEKSWPKVLIQGGT